MADQNINKTPNENRQNEMNEQSKGEFDKNRKPEQGGLDKDREKSAIGGGQSQSGNQATGQQSGQNRTGQTDTQSSTGQNKEFDKDKSRTEPTGR